MDVVVLAQQLTFFVDPKSKVAIKMMRKEYTIAIINQSLVLSIRSNRHGRSYEH